MDLRPDRKSNRLAAIRDNEAADALDGKKPDARQATLPGLEGVLRKTIKQATARQAFDETTLAIRGALQIASKAATTESVELRLDSNHFNDASKRLEAAQLANVKSDTPETRAALRRAEVEHERTLERLHQRRKTSTQLQAAVSLIVKAAHIAGFHELGDKVDSIKVTGAGKLREHLTVVD